MGGADVSIETSEADVNNIGGEQDQQDGDIAQEASPPDFAYQLIRATITNPVGPTCE